jgi:outer membrane protein assembly factor BamB
VAGVTVYVGATDGVMYAVNAATGTLEWKFESGGRIPSSAAAADGSVYFTSYDGNLYALDAATGKERWHFGTAGERRFAAPHLNGWQPAGEVMPDPFDVYLSSPAVAAGTVYFGSGDHKVYAVDAATGALKWKFETGDVVHSSPAIVGDTLYIGSWDRYLYALDTQTGAVRWKFETPDDTAISNQKGIQSSPAVADGTVYFGCRCGAVFAVDAHTGKQKWRFDTGGAWANASPAVRGDRVWVATADGRSFIELDARTGKQVFAWQTSWYFFASPAIAGDMAYIGNWDGRLTAIDLRTRRPAWVFQTDSSRLNLGRFVTPGGAMNFRAAKPDPTSRFYDDMSAAVNRIFTMGSFLGSAVVAGGVLYVGSMDGTLYALK